jgi:hypothetical protein
MQARAAAPLLACVFLAATAAGCLVASSDSRHQGGTGNGYGGGSGGAGGAGGGGGYPAYGGSGGGSVPLACAGGTSNDFKVAWTIEDASGAPSSCDGVVAQEMDLDMLNLGSNANYHGVFACSDMMGTSCALPAGSYSVAMRLRDGKGALLSELVIPQTLPITDGQTNDLGSIPFSASMGMTGPGQGIGLAWTIQRQGATITCTDAGAATLEVDIGDQKFPFTCDDGKGTTPPVTVGTYDVKLQLLDGQGTALSVTQTMSVVIPAGKLVDLGSVPFDVN